MNRPPKLIGTTDLWSGYLGLNAPFTPEAIQAVVTDYVAESGITVVGYYSPAPSSVTLLRWPETREGYVTPSIPECNIALQGLAARLQAQDAKTNVITGRKIHVMMGRRISGYDGGEMAPFTQLQRPGLRGYSVTAAHMVSARTVRGEQTTTIEPYGEPAGVIVAAPKHEQIIHDIGDELRQFHYAIERGPTNAEAGRTDFYETQWASTEA